MGSLTTRQLPHRRSRVPKRRHAGQLQAGVTLQDRYKIMNTLGVGGFSSVYQARDLHFPNVTRLCAVKEMINLNRDAHARELATSSFEREANILATMDHPAVPDVFDYFTDEDRSYLVLEYISGQDLEAYLAERTDFVPTEIVLDWILQICDVLAYLHSREPQSVVFRDLKPSNIMLDKYDRIRLIDFGIAKVFQSGVKGTMIGTEGYAPPEQYRGESSPAGDIYALGATMHHVLSMQDPRSEPPFSFGERSIRAVNVDVIPSVETIIDRCLSYEVADRYQDAAELRAALKSIAVRVATGDLVFSENVSQPVAVIDSPRNGKPIHAQHDNSRGLDAPNISPVWTFSCEDEIRSTAAVSRGVVYVGAYDNNLYAVSKGEGEFIWKYPTTDGIASSPFVYQDQVFMGSADSHLYSLRRSTGRLNWRYGTGGPIYSSPRADYDHVFFGSDDGYLYALNVSDGRRVWQAKAHSTVRSSPCVGEERIYFGTEGGYVFCLDLSGQIQWQFQAKRSITSSPALAEDMIIVGSRDSTVYAIDANSGWALWRFRTKKPIVSSPTIADGVVYIGSSDGNLYALDIFSGQQTWLFEADGQINSSPAVWEDAIYFGATDGCLYCVSAKRGKLRWRFKSDGMFVASPTIVDGVIYVGSCDHNLYALPT